jgi:Predicted metal-dependent RNase, consists of a metallo-beta-lactamase domain and an RNA-binding KH domain
LKITFLGAAGEVGRSCIMIEEDGTRVLLDSGIKLGKKIEYPELDKETLKGVDGIVVSHAHLDHSGYLPHIYSIGYDKYAYATKPRLNLRMCLLATICAFPILRDNQAGLVFHAEEAQDSRVWGGIQDKEPKVQAAHCRAHTRQRDGRGII